MRVVDLRKAIAERLGKSPIVGEIRADVVAELTARMARGNRKLPKTTLVLNIGGAATDCESKRLGLCPIPEGKCYALKAERAYPDCLPARRATAALTREASAAEIAAAVLECRERFAIKTWRVSESGDYRDQDDVDKVHGAAALLHEHCPALRAYGYTARRDLVHTQDYFVTNGSGFRADNEFRAARREDIPAGALVCPGDCRQCAICSRAHGRIMYVPLH